VRDRDVRLAVLDALVATDQFNDVWPAGLPEEVGTGAYEQAAAALDQSRGTSEQYGDADPEGGLLQRRDMTITILYRHHDPLLRDAAAERLLNVVCNTINGNNLGGLVFAQTALVRSWSWEKATAPERRISATYHFEYMVEGWTNFDVTD
jgi:hypothetical protein